MSHHTDVTVHFSCPHCLAVFRSLQVHTTDKCLGKYQCSRCDTPVHEWTGFYDFSDWSRVIKSRAKPRRVW